MGSTNEAYKICDKITREYHKLYISILENLNELGKNEVTFNHPVRILRCATDKVEYISIKGIKFDYNSFIKERLDFLLRIIYDVIDFKNDKVIKENQEIPIFEIEESEGFHLVEIIEKLNVLIEREYFEKSFPRTMFVENKDIIITDPCYIRKPDLPSKKETKNDIDYDSYDLINKNGWDVENLTLRQVVEIYKKRQELDDIISKQQYGNNNEVVDDWTLCFSQCLTCDTLYGDWSCTTYNTDTNEVIGEFCADTGEVGVFLLDEVLKYNPEFDYHINRKWTTTLIKNFTGEVSIIKRHNKGVYEDDTKWHKKGETWEEDSIHVIGKGNINFETTQTGF